MNSIERADDLMSSFKIIACGDIHAEYDLFELVLKKALDEKADLLVLTGDFCNGRKLPSDAAVENFIKQAEPIKKILAKTPIQTFFIFGNHDPIELSLGPEEESAECDPVSTLEGCRRLVDHDCQDFGDVQAHLIKAFKRSGAL
ncbi:MAG: metallophosphoesterase [Candidatus Hermodarchaeota archaeon]